MSTKKSVTLGLILIAIAALTWLLTTTSPAVWPVRHTLQYRLMRGWWSLAGAPQTGSPGTLQGLVTGQTGQPIAGAWVLVSTWDGTTYHSQSRADGAYTIAGIPAGAYRPVAGAAGYAGHIESDGWGSIAVHDGQVSQLNFMLEPETPRPVAPGQNLSLGEPTTLTCTTPLQGSAVRRQVMFDNAGKPNQATYFYTPVNTGPHDALPALLAVYPGPADGWECASLPLAAAGYAVLGIGPAYSFDLEADIDELERLAQFARGGNFPGVDPTRLAVLGGSYSGLHVQRLLQRNPDFQAALLLGPPTDLFDMRRRLEEGSYVPPYGLDQALIALGLPSRQPRLYWQYSGAYHVRPNFPPIILLHSRSDAVVPYQQTELLAANLAAAGIEHETHFFDGAGHYLLDEGGGADPIFKLALDFLARHLP
jgi:hypothetical protein